MDIEKIIYLLEKQHGRKAWNWHTQTKFHVLIGTLLSQRTRDMNTDKAAKHLFSKFPTAEKLSKASTKEIEELIKPSGFYKVKAERIKEIAKKISQKYGGKVPEDMEELVKLPGVGRKTANCVLVYGFGKPAIPVDTHVHRITNRLGLVKTKKPEETEMELMKVIPKKYWTIINELLVKHGQGICKPVKPLCSCCPLLKHCTYGKIYITQMQKKLWKQ